jgi:hypothetical protein
LLLYPKRDDVEFLGDSESKLKKYFFGQKRKPHLFCGECSSNVMIDFADSDAEDQRPFLAINVSGVFSEITEAEYDPCTQLRVLMWLIDRLACSRTLIWTS